MSAPASLNFRVERPARVAQPPAPRSPLGAPVDPYEMAALSPFERGQCYNRADLDSWQRRCAEDAVRLIEAGRYPAGGRG